MKKINLFILAILLLANMAIAQTSINLVTGANISSTSVNSGLTDMIDVKPITRLSAGLIADHKLDNKLSVSTGLIYKQKGFEIDQTTGVKVIGMNLPVGVMVTNTVNYLEVPLLLKYNLKPVSGIEPYIGIGPSVAYATSGQLDTRARAGIFDVNVMSNKLELSSPDYNRTQVVGNALAGVKLAYGKGHWIAEIGHSKSFTDLVSDNFTVDAGGRHSDWNFSIGYGLTF